MDYYKVLLEDGSVVVSDVEYKELLGKLNVEGIEVYAFDYSKGKVYVELVQER